jgi:hypothetical protein
MYLTMLALHSILRWVVILAGLNALARAVVGAAGAKGWMPADHAAARWFTISLDVQLLVGVVLYGALSPLTAAALRDMGTAMGNPTLRYWAVEHALGMVVAVALAHVGRARIRKAPNDAARHRTARIFFALALVAILASIPWPSMTNGRPMFPGL